MQQRQPGSRSGGQAEGDDALLPRPTHAQGSDNRIEVAFAAGPDAAAGARNTLLALGPALDETLLGDIRLLVSELVTNSVRHSGAGRQAVVDMRVEVDDDIVRVEVSDPGNGFEPKPRDLDRSRPGGWGLYLVDQLADRWGVEREDRTRVWFEIDAAGARRTAGVAA